MRMEEETARKNRSGQRPGEAPAGYWWAVGALVALACAAMLLHEAASWVLDMAPLWGAPVNVRAFSCDAHSLGLVFGYAFARLSAASISPPRGRRRVLGRFLRRGLRQHARVLLVFGGAARPFRRGGGEVLRGGGRRLVLRGPKPSGLGGGHKAVHDHHRDGNRLHDISGAGTLQHAGGHGRPGGLRAVHLALVPAAAFCLARAMVPGSCFREGYAAVVFAPSAPHPMAGRQRAEGDVQGAAASVDDAAGANAAGPNRAVPLCARLLHYRRRLRHGVRLPPRHPLGAAFGGGGAGGVVPRRRRGGARPVRRHAAPRPRRGRLAHLEPLLSFRVPRRLRGGAPQFQLTNSSEFLPALVVQACAPCSYFDALLAIACSVISRIINAAPSQVFGRAFLIRSVELSAWQPHRQHGVRARGAGYRGLLRHRHGGVRPACASSPST